jgi:hypothetical protein
MSVALPSRACSCSWKWRTARSTAAALNLATSSRPKSSAKTHQDRMQTCLIHAATHQASQLCIDAKFVPLDFTSVPSLPNRRRADMRSLGSRTVGCMKMHQLGAQLRAAPSHWRLAPDPQLRVPRT